MAKDYSLSPEETLIDRYTINRYSVEHAAIDCRECNFKIFDLTMDSPHLAGKILEAIEMHHDQYHRKTVTVFKGIAPVRHRR